MLVKFAIQRLSPQIVADHNFYHGISSLFDICHTRSPLTYSHLWRERGASDEPGVLGWIPVELLIAGLWAQVTLEDTRFSWRPRGICFTVVRNSCSAPPLFVWTKEQTQVLLLGCCLFTALPSSFEMTHNYFSTGQIFIPGFKLTWCYAVKCCLNFVCLP